MQTDDSTLRTLLTTNFTEAVIRLGLIILLLVLCVRVFAPFTNLMLWALILAIALYPLQQRIAVWLGGRQGVAATLLVAGALLIIGVPTLMLGNSIAHRVRNAYVALESNRDLINPPNRAVADWPLVGKKVYHIWSTAADNLPALLEENQTQIKTIAKRTLLATANTAGSLLNFLGALIVAGIMMAYGEAGRRTMQRILNRLAGVERGPRLLNLVAATIRSVANGVIGVAFIQALLLGTGFLLSGIPASGVLALVVLFLGIVQLPASIVSLPVIGYLWWAGEASTASNIFFSIYLLLAGMVDNILKPLLLGRGVEAPMPVILLGALGGMVSAGIIGLFIGPVLLAVGYRIFMEWVDLAEAGPDAESVSTGSGDQTVPAGE